MVRKSIGSNPDGKSQEYGTVDFSNSKQTTESLNELIVSDDMMTLYSPRFAAIFSVINQIAYRISISLAYSTLA
jgi:hypothetical protein